MKKQFLKKLVLLMAGLLLLDIFLQYQLFLQYKNNRIVAVSLHLADVRARLETRMTGSLLLLKGTANYIALTPGLTQAGFDRYAHSLLHHNPLLKNLAFAEDFKVKFVSPLTANQPILGLDYRSLPGQWDQVRRVAETGQLLATGPLELVQGGTGLIGRAPVTVEQQGAERVLGIISAVIDMDKLFAESGLNDSHLTIALRGVDGFGADGAVFLGSSDLFSPEREAVLMDVTFPGGSWQLAGLPKHGWLTSTAPPFAFTVHGLLLLLGGALAVGMFRSTQNNHQIETIQKSLAEAQAIAHLGSWKIDLKDNSTWWSEESYRIFGVSPSSFQPSLNKIHEQIHPDDMPKFEAFLEQARTTGKSYELDHRIIQPDGSQRHVQARGQVEFDDTGKPLHITGTILDITEQKLAELALRASEEMNRAMAEASLDALITIDSEDRIIFWSPAAEKMFGWSKQEALQQKLHDLIVPEQYRKEAQEGLSKFINSGRGPVINHVREVTALRKDGSCFPVDLSVAAFSLDNRYYAHGSLRDATERKATEENLQWLATTDELTGLLNRRRFMELAEQEFNRASRYRSSMTLIMFDADRFKTINDTFGHDGGDEILRALAREATSVLREVDIIGRIGGEEFTIVLPQTGLKGGLQLAERLRQKIAESRVNLPDGRRARVTISLGVAELSPELGSLDELIKAADIALYQAKENGRNRVVTAPALRDEDNTRQSG